MPHVIITFCDFSVMCILVQESAVEEKFVFHVLPELWTRPTKAGQYSELCSQ